MEKEQYLHIPSYILNDSSLDSSQRILLSEIFNLSKNVKGCYASNDYFGNLLNINPEGASKQITKLKHLGYIETKRYYKNHKMKRLITIIYNPIIVTEKNIYVNIPYSVLFDEKLSTTQKILLSEIIALIKLPDGCTKSNSEFGDILNINASSVSKQLKKLVEMHFIVTNDKTAPRKIELTSSYNSTRLVPKSQNGCSQNTTRLVPKSQNGCSHKNTINTINNSLEIVPILAQYTNTENLSEKSELEIVEQNIVESCERGQELLEEIRQGNSNNFWKYVQQKQAREYIIQLIKDYKIATNKLDLNEE